MEKNANERRQRAKKKIEEIKGFYIHLFAYLCVNLFLTTRSLIGSFQDGKALGEVFWDLDHYVIWIFWGIGLAFHAMKVLDYNPFFGKEWEERQIKKYMEQDRREFEKYNQ